MASSADLFISGFYDPDVSKLEEWGVSLIGNYFRDNCGGPCQWAVSSKHPNSDAIFSLPYHGERYVFVFDYYDDYTPEEIEQAPLTRRIPEGAIKCNERTYVLLTDTKLSDYDHDTETALDVHGEIVENDDLWGMISCGDIDRGISLTEFGDPKDELVQRIAQLCEAEFDEYTAGIAEMFGE